jgi:hypothetical protein
MAIRQHLLRQALATLALLATDAAGQTTFTASLANPGVSSVPAGAPFELTIIATFDRRLSAMTFELAASGDADARLTGRSAHPAEPNGLTYISNTSQDPFEAGLPHDFAIGPVTEMLVDMDYDDIPSGVSDGCVPGSNVVIERVLITPTTTGSLTIALSNLQALTTEDNPDGVLFDAIGVSQSQVTVTVMNNARLTAEAGNDQAVSVCFPTITLAGTASGGTPPYTYTWTAVQHPDGSGSVSIANPGAPSTSVTVVPPVLEGLYEVRLSVTDGLQSNSTDTVQLTVHADHPADSDENWSASISEVTAYGACWRSGCDWPMPPSPVPVEALTRIGYLWRQGESYRYEPTLAYPDCWQPGAAGSPVVATASTDKMVSAMKPAAGADDAAHANRSITPDSTQPGRYLIQIQADPTSITAAWAVEEQVPAGWSVQDINEQGSLDINGGKVKWGIFFDSQPRTLMYSLIRPTGSADSAVLSGTLSIDGHNSEVLGSSSVPEITSDDPARPARGLSCGPGIPQALLFTGFFMLLTMLRRNPRP